MLKLLVIYVHVSSFSSSSQVEELKEFGVFFSSLVQELAGLRGSAVRGLTDLQAEHDKLAEQIRQAQERHETVSRPGEVSACFNVSDTNGTGERGWVNDKLNPLLCEEFSTRFC